MKIVAVGGAGFIGWHFSRFVATETDDEILVADNFSNAAVSKEFLGSKKVKFFEVDISTTRDWKFLDGADRVINFAAETHNDESLERPTDFFKANLLGALNLLEACRLRNIWLHQVSTDEVFGDTSIDSQVFFDETSPYKPSSPYSATKAGADLLVMAWARSFGMKTSISYCTNNFGTYQGLEKFIPRTLSRIIAGVPPLIYGTGENIRDWLSVRDHVRGLYLVLTKGSPGSRYFFSGGTSISNIRLAEMLLNIADSDLRVEHMSDRPGHDRRYALDSSRTRNELGWSPKESFEESLVECLRFYELESKEGKVNLSNGYSSRKSMGG